MALSRFILPFADVGSGIKPSSGAQLFFYETGTSTLKDTFTDASGTIPNANPVIANASGVFGDIFITDTYKVVLQDKNNSQIWEADPVTSTSASELSVIARSLNVEDGQVIYSSDTTTVLDDVLYIYDASAQITWALPALDSTGKTVVTVVGAVLTTTGGTGSNTYILLVVGDSHSQIFASDYKSTANTWDDALADAIADAVLTRSTLQLGNSNINISNDLLIPNTMDVRQGSRGAIIGVGTNDVIITNAESNGKKKVFGTIDGMDRALVVRGSINDIEFQALSNSRQCLVIESLSGANIDRSLDNVIKGTQIGNCDDAIVFQQNNDSTIQQGNQIEVNFISGCKDAIVFDDNGQHTQQGDWDSNNVQLQAIDNQKDNASFILNRSAFPVNNQTLESHSWNGGLLAPNSNIVKGQFRGCVIKMITASPTTADDICELTDASVLSTGKVVIKRGGGKINPGGGEMVTAIATQLSADFNGGVQLQGNTVLVDYTLPVLINAGATERCFVFHALAFSDDYQPFTITPFNTVTMQSVDNFAQSGVGNTGDRGMISIWMYNKTGAVINAGANFKFVLRQNYKD